MPTLATGGGVVTLPQRARSLARHGKINRASSLFVEDFTKALLEGIENLKISLKSEHPPEAQDVEDVQVRLTRLTTDLSALGEVLDRPRVNKDVAFVVDVVRQIDPTLRDVDVFVVHQLGPTRALRSLHKRWGRQLCLVIWVPDPRFARPPLLGTLAHEAAHCHEEVDVRLSASNMLLRRRGEVLADLFASAGIGPGFAWALSAYLVGEAGQALAWETTSAAHPPWQLRVTMLTRFARLIWDGPDIHEWFLARLRPGADSLPSTPSFPARLVEDYTGDAQQFLSELRKVKLSERDMRRVRGVFDPGRGLRPALSFASLCPG